MIVSELRDNDGQIQSVKLDLTNETDRGMLESLRRYFLNGGVVVIKLEGERSDIWRITKGENHD